MLPCSLALHLPAVALAASFGTGAQVATTAFLSGISPTSPSSSLREACGPSSTWREGGSVGAVPVTKSRALSCTLQETNSEFLFVNSTNARRCAPTQLFLRFHWHSCR